MEFRALTDADRPGIVALYGEVFPASAVTLDSHRWFTGSHEGESIVTGGVEDGQVVAHYAVQLRTLQVGDQVLRAGVGVSTMVLPKYRNLHVLESMTLMNYDICRQHEIPFLYGFAKDRFWPILKHLLGWKGFDQLPAYELATVSDDAIERQVTEMSSERPALNFPDVKAGNVENKWSDAFFDWRYRRNPTATYRLLRVQDGIGILKRYVSAEGVVTGHLVDWRTADGDQKSTFERLLRAASATFADEGVAKLTLWLPFAGPFLDAALEVGMIRGSHLTNFAYLDLDGRFGDILADQNNWVPRMGDSDVY